jgi:hypothetical protein
LCRSSLGGSCLKRSSACACKCSRSGGGSCRELAGATPGPWRGWRLLRWLLLLLLLLLVLVLVLVL